MKKTLLASALPLIATATLGQVQINGTAYDRSMMYDMRGVSVMGASGTGTYGFTGSLSRILSRSS